MKIYEFRLTFAPKGQINSIPALVQIMAWRRPGDKPLSEPMMVLKLICFTRPQCVKNDTKETGANRFRNVYFSILTEFPARDMHAREEQQTNVGDVTPERHGH